MRPLRSCLLDADSEVSPSVIFTFRRRSHRDRTGEMHASSTTVGRPVGEASAGDLHVADLSRRNRGQIPEPSVD